MLAIQTTYSKYILAFAIGVLLIILPQINFSNYPQSTITSKFIVFSYCCLAILGSYMVVFVLAKKVTIKISRLDLALLLLVGYLSLNRYFIQPNYGLSIRYIELIGLSVFYIILRALSLKTFLWFLVAIITSGSIQAIYGILQLLQYYPSNHVGFELTGSFFNPGPYAGFLATVWIIALGMYLYKDWIIPLIVTSRLKPLHIVQGLIIDYLPLVGMVSIFLVLPSAHSRGAWLSIILSTLFLLEFRLGYIKRVFNKLNRTKQIVMMSFIVCVLSAGLFGVYHFKKGSADGRLFIWKVTTQIIKDFPITGVGFDRFKAHYMNYQADYFNAHGETEEAFVADNSYYAFNEWLQFIVENGVFGFLFLVLVLLLLAKINVEATCTAYGSIGTATFMAIGIFGLFSYPMQILPIKLVMVVVIAFMGSLNKDKFPINIGVQRLYVSLLIKSSLILIVGMGIIKGVSYVRKLDANFKIWNNALNLYHYQDYKYAVKMFGKAYPKLRREGDFLMNYGKALSMDSQHKKATQILEEAKLYLNTTIVETTLGDAYKGIEKYSEAERAYQHAANMIPVRFYPLYLQAKLYEESGQQEKAIDMAKTILKKNVKVPSTAIKEIKAEMETLYGKNTSER